MIYSRYNFLLNSSKYGLFIYNSVYNSFFKIKRELFDQLSRIKNNPNDIKNLDKDTFNFLINNKILVNHNEDDSYIIKKKYLSYLKSFSEDSLGIIIVPTMNCNFACPYCYEDGLPKDIMTEEIQKKVIRFIESFNCAKNDVQLCWHGGEPLLAFNAMVRILDKLYSNPNIKITRHDMVTNGYLLTKDKIEILRKYNLGYVQITIDGLEEDHNKSRPLKSGLPTFRKIIENVEYILNYHPECFVNIRINVHENNKERIHLLYTELTDKWKNFNCYIHMVYVSPYNHCKVECVKLSERIPFFRDMYRKYGVNNIDFFPKKEEYGCSATNQNSYIIGPFGELYKCWVDVGKPEHVIGTVDDKIANLSLVSEYLVGTDMFGDEKCQKCFLFPVCDGGCNLIRYEAKIKNQPFNNCPIETDDFSTLLELFYEQKINNQPNCVPTVFNK
mgnify:CR=1 FL=1